MSYSNKVLVITRWFPNDCDPVKGIFVKNTLLEQSKNNKYQYVVISPIPYFPRINIGFIAKWIYKYTKINYYSKIDKLTIYYPKYIKLPHPLTNKVEWITYYRSVLKTISRERIDFNLIHTHGLYPDSFVAIKIGKLLNIPVVVHIHDSYFNRLYSKYRKEIDEIMYNAKIIIPVSNFQRNNVISKYKKYEGKIITVYNGVKIDNFCENYCSIYKENMNTYYIVYVGNLVKLKGLEVLIKAFSLLSKKHQIRLDIFGTGKEENKYRALVKKLSLSESVIFKGFIENRLLPEVLAKYSLLVLPSYFETFGIVLIEAMACGLPVVASNVGAIPEIVKSEEVGILVKPGDYNLMSEAIEKAMKIEWNTSKIKDSVKYFSIEKTAKAIVNIYDKIIKS